MSRYMVHLILPIALGLTLSACGSGDAAEAPYYHRVSALSLEVEPGYTIQRRFAGRVEARQSVELGFELAGSIDQVLVDEGDRVMAGQILATLDTRLLKVQRQELQAQRDEIRARRELAALEMKRQRKLSSKGFSAQQRIDELRAESGVLAAQLKRQSALLSAVETRLQKSSIFAPFTGDIASRYVDVSTVTSSGQPVVQILEQGATEARVGLPAELARTLDVAAEVSVEVARQRVTARVIAIGQQVDQGTRTVSVRLSLPQSLEVADGELLYLSLPEARSEEGYWLPSSALSAGVRGMWNVYVLVQDDDEALYRLESRSINLLHVSGDRSFVEGAVVAGEQVVASGIHRVVPGQLVRNGSRES